MTALKEQEERTRAEREAQELAALEADSQIAEPKARRVGWAGDMGIMAVGYVGLDGQCIPVTRGGVVGKVMAQWNGHTRRCELVREERGVRLTVWVKGAQYLAGHLNNVDGLAAFWDPERIDADGGCLVQADLGRIPGERAEPATLAAALQYLVSYDIDAGLGSATLPSWAVEDKQVEDVRRRSRVITVVIAVIFLYFFLDTWWYYFQRHRKAVARHKEQLAAAAAGQVVTLD